MQHRHPEWPNRQFFSLCLFDSGSSATLLNERAIPAFIKPKVGEPQRFTTTQGSYTSNKFFMAKTISFPEFCKTPFVPELAVRTFHSPSSWYDIIVGHDILHFGFILDHTSKTVSWDGLPIPMVTPVPSVPKTLITQYICAKSTNRYHSYVNFTAQIKEA